MTNWRIERGETSDKDKYNKQTQSSNALLDLICCKHRYSNIQLTNRFVAIKIHWNTVFVFYGALVTGHNKQIYVYTVCMLFTDNGSNQ